MNRLVMDYLVGKGYRDVAEAFWRDAGTKRTLLKLRSAGKFDFLLDPLALLTVGPLCSPRRFAERSSAYEHPAATAGRTNRARQGEVAAHRAEGAP
jgi:hypothetical protein